MHWIRCFISALRNLLYDPFSIKPLVCSVPASQNSRTVLSAFCKTVTWRDRWLYCSLDKEKSLEQRSVSIALSWLLLPPEVGVNRHGLNSIESVNHSPSPLLFSPTPTASPVHAPTHDSPPLHLAPLTVSLPFQYTHKLSSTLTNIPAHSGKLCTHK